MSANGCHQNSGVPCAPQFRTFFRDGVIFSVLWFLLGVGIFTFVP